jgi:anti-repressor protein
MKNSSFNFNGYELKVVIDDFNNPFFIAKDVCNILQIKNNRDALSRLDDDEKGVVLTDTPGGKQDVLCINESGLYSLVLSSRKQEAKDFKKWVTSEVLPSIRKTGAYITLSKAEELLANPDLIISLATQVKIEKERNNTLQLENNRLRPRSEFVDKVFATDGLISMSQVAKVLGLTYGRNTLYKILREKGVLFKTSNEPKQELVTRGFFEVKEKKISRTGHPDKLVLTTYVTQKGLGYIAKLLGVISTPSTPILITS